MAAAGDIEIASRPQFERRNFLGALAKTVGDIVPRDDEIATLIVAPAQYDMNMRVVGVVMIDRDPVEARVKIALRRRHDGARIAIEIVELARVFRRKDDPELMAVAPPLLQKRLAVRFVAIRAVELARRAVFLGAVALDIAQTAARALPRPLAPRRTERILTAARRM